MKSKYVKEYSNLKKMDIKPLKAWKLAFDFTKRNRAGKNVPTSNGAFRNLENAMAR